MNCPPDRRGGRTGDAIDGGTADVVAPGRRASRPLRSIALTADDMRRLQAGVDVNRQAPEVGDGVPCRRGPADVAAGQPRLALSCRPFPSPRPGAEYRPTFLHRTPCASDAEANAPPVFATRRRLPVRGCDADDRIVRGTDAQVAAGEPAGAAAEPPRRPGAACVHVRCATRNGHPSRIARG